LGFLLDLDQSNPLLTEVSVISFRGRAGRPCKKTALLWDLSNRARANRFLDPQRNRRLLPADFAESAFLPLAGACQPFFVVLLLVNRRRQAMLLLLLVTWVPDHGAASTCSARAQMIQAFILREIPAALDRYLLLLQIFHALPPTARHLAGVLLRTMSSTETALWQLIGRTLLPRHGLGTHQEDQVFSIALQLHWQQMGLSPTVKQVHLPVLASLVLGLLHLTSQLLQNSTLPHRLSWDSALEDPSLAKTKEREKKRRRR